MKPPGLIPGSVPTPGWLISYRRALLRTDAVVVVLAVLVAECGRAAGFARAVTGSPAGIDWAFAVALVALWLGCLAAEGTWQLDAVGTGLTECRRIVRAGVVVFAVVGIIGYLTDSDLARGYLVIAVPLGVVGLLTNHLLWRRRLLLSRAAGDRLLSVLVAGDRLAAAELCGTLQAQPGAGYRPIGVCVPLDRSTLPGPVSGVPVRGDLDQVASVALACGANAVAVAESGLSAERVSQLAVLLEGTGVGLLIAPGVADDAGPGARVRAIAGLPLFRISESRLEGGRAVLKTAVDVVVSVLAIVLLSPFMLIALIAVPIGDGGPALSRRDYVGRGGRVLHAWMFRCVPLGRTRSQLVGATRGSAAGGDLRDQDRTGANGRPITSVGRILRRTGLDESPLLFGVLAGRLSLVGPEPGVIGTGDEYVRRPLVRPGITGPWRLAGIGAVADPAAVVNPAADFRYVENWSVLGDLAMVAGTVRAIVSGRAPSWLRA